MNIKFNFGQFVRNVTLLSAGTAIAQIIPLVASPVLTRLYSPESFGLFAAFMALISSVIPAVTGKYEVAMVLPKSERIAKELFSLSIWFGGGVSLLYWFFLSLFEQQVVDWLKIPALQDWIYFVPMVLFLSGLLNLCVYLGNRYQSYHLLARSKVIQALCVVFVNLLLGWLGIGFIGLLLGNFFGLMVALSYLLYKQKNLLMDVHFKWTKKKIVALKKYYEFPVFSASFGLLDGVTVSLPIFFLMSGYSEAAVGYYALVARIMNAPFIFLSTSISQVNLKKVADLVKQNRRLDRYLLKLSIGLLLFSMLPVLVLLLTAPSLFAWVFGEQWRVAGEYAQILSPALAFRFVASTLSSTISATHNNRYGAFWKVCAFVSTGCVLLYFTQFADIKTTLYALMFNDIFLYILYYALIFKAAMNPRKQ
ncbi:MAG: oligosaccharide flippase family protein [Gammaproteobacteria bacterium]|nr:oligosaccharide flippase family protein [Gammaproteobacteria bacterium]